MNDVDNYLRQAEQFEANAIPVTVNEWRLRLRSIYWLRMGNAQRANDFAQQATRVDPLSNAAILVATQAGLLWLREQVEQQTINAPEASAKRYLELRKAVDPLVELRYGNADAIYADINHSLGKDQETRRRFETILEKNKSDGSAIRTLMSVCSDFLANVDCAYSAALTLSQTRPSDPGDQLDIAEAAILKGDYPLAKKWIEAAESQTGLGIDYQVIAQLYKVWLALAEHSATASQDFGEWLLAAQTVREKELKNFWTFDGAKKALQTSSLATNDRNLLRAMIAAVEDRGAPIPQFDSQR